MTHNEAAQNAGDKFSRLKSLPDQLRVTDRMGIKRIGVEDIATLFEIIDRNPDIRNNVAWASRVRTIEDVRPSLQHYSNEDMDGRYAIVGDEEVVGYIGIHPGAKAGVYGIGYFLDESARGQGFVASAVSALAEQAKLQLGAEQVYLQIRSDNTASLAVPQNLGFYQAETVMGVDFPVEQQRWRLDL